MKAMQKNRERFYRSGKGFKPTALQVFKRQREPYKPIKCTTAIDVRFEKEEKKYLRNKPRRRAVGWIRAFLGPHFLAGSHAGAEND